MKKKWTPVNSEMGGMSVPNGSKRASYALFRRLGVPLLLGTVVAWLVFVFFVPKLYEAECRCAMVEGMDPIVTNATGSVVQPLERMLQQGSYVDMKQFATCFFEDCLAGRHLNRKPIETFVSDPSNAVFPANQVRNAFDSLECEAEGVHVASLRISARAHDAGLALKVLDHVVRELELILGEWNKARREKATVQVRESIQRFRRRGEDYSLEQRKYEKVLRACEKTEPRMEVLLPPHLSKDAYSVMR